MPRPSRSARRRRSEQATQAVRRRTRAVQVGRLPRGTGQLRRGAPEAAGRSGRARGARAHALRLGRVQARGGGAQFVLVECTGHGLDDDEQPVRQHRRLSSRNCASSSNTASRIPTTLRRHFVLAYQYLVIDSKDAAVNALKVVVKNQPKDYTAKRMLDALAPPEPPAPHGCVGDASPAATRRKPTWSATGGPRPAIRRSIWRSPKIRSSPGRPRRPASRRWNSKGNWLRPATSSSWKARTRARWPAPSSRSGPTSGSSP